MQDSQPRLPSAAAKRSSGVEKSSSSLERLLMMMLNTLLVQAKTKLINQPAVAQEKFEEVLRIAKQQNETGVN